MKDTPQTTDARRRRRLVTAKSLLGTSLLGTSLSLLTGCAGLTGGPTANQTMPWQTQISSSAAPAVSNTTISNTAAPQFAGAAPQFAGAAPRSAGATPQSTGAAPLYASQSPVQTVAFQSPAGPGGANPPAANQPYVARQFPQTTPPPPVFNPNNPAYSPGFDPNAPVLPPGAITSAIQQPTVREADLVINGFPARTGRIMLGGAVNSDAGVTGQITIDERNFDITRFPTSFRDLFSGTAFRGAGQTFRIEAAPGTEFKRYTAQFVDPNLFGYLPISMSLSGFWYDRRFNDWNEERLGGRVAFGYRVTPDLSVNFGVSGQNVNIETNRTGPPALTDVIGDNELYTGQISLTHDTRNSPIQASRGHFFQFSFEEAFGDFDYARFETEFRQYWLLRERADGSGRQTLSYSTRVGFSGDETPVFENFFAGGYATIRGFDFRGASPIVNGVEVGGRFQWLNTLEYMFPITADDAFRGVAFVDFGTVEDEIEIDPDSFRVAPGVGLRVAIPMLGPAPLAFDFAFPVNKADTDETRVFSFYMSLIR